jgi:hypothetical protein
VLYTRPQAVDTPSTLFVDILGLQLGFALDM